MTASHNSSISSIKSSESVSTIPWTECLECDQETGECCREHGYEHLAELFGPFLWFGHVAGSCFWCDKKMAAVKICGILVWAFSLMLILLRTACTLYDFITSDSFSISSRLALQVATIAWLVFYYMVDMNFQHISNLKKTSLFAFYISFMCVFALATNICNAIFSYRFEMLINMCDLKQLLQVNAAVNVRCLAKKLGIFSLIIVILVTGYEVATPFLGLETPYSTQLPLPKFLPASVGCLLEMCCTLFGQVAMLYNCGGVILLCYTVSHIIDALLLKLENAKSGSATLMDRKFYTSIQKFYQDVHSIYKHIVVTVDKINGFFKHIEMLLFVLSSCMMFYALYNGFFIMAQKSWKSTIFMASLTMVFVPPLISSILMKDKAAKIAPALYECVQMTECFSNVPCCVASHANLMISYIKSNEIVLTASDFVKLDRKAISMMGSIIATYVIIIIQFDQTNSCKE